MDEQPQSRRRWPRFKLSTILVLVGILAWGMSMRPWWRHNWDQAMTRAEWLEAANYTNHQHLRFGHKNWGGVRNPIPTNSFWKEVYGPNPALVWPLLALAAFLTWKIAWWYAARRKRVRERAIPNP